MILDDFLKTVLAGKANKMLSSYDVAWDDFFRGVYDMHAAIRWNTG